MKTDKPYSDTLRTNLSSAQNFLYVPRNLEKSYFSSSDDFDPSNSVFEIIIKNLQNNTKILDVGCAHGHFGNYLKNNLECRVYGLEIDGGAVENAKSHHSYTDILCIDIETLSNNLNELIQRGFNGFDAIVCADILEHTRNINEITLVLFELLKRNGVLLISVPNIGHIDIVYNLIKNDFNYSPFGILDNSHLRFFTKKSFVQWINLLSTDNGIKLEIELIGQTHIEEVFEAEGDDKELLHLKMKKLLDLYKEIGGSEDVFVYQNVFKIRPIEGSMNRMEGEHFFEQGKIDEAIVSFKKAVSIDPKSATNHSNLGAVYHHIGELEKATEHLATALKLEPENRDVVWNCGQILLEIGQIGNALQLYETFSKKHPRDSEFKEVVRKLVNND